MKQTDIDPNVLQWIFEDCYKLTDDDAGSALQSRAATRLAASLSLSSAQLINEATGHEFRITFDDQFVGGISEGSILINVLGSQVGVLVELIDCADATKAIGGDVLDAYESDQDNGDDEGLDDEG